MMIEPRPVVIGGADAGAAEDDAAGREIRARARSPSARRWSSAGIVDQRQQASITSPRLCGGMLVAMPTAMPPAPLTSRFGKRAGRTVGSRSRCRRSSAGSRRCPCRCRRAAPSATLGQARLGVAHRRRRIAVHRAEIALPVDQRQAHREVLRHAHQRVVDRLVAVRVVFTHHVADDARRLAVGLVRQS